MSSGVPNLLQEIRQKGVPLVTRVPKPYQTVNHPSWAPGLIRAPHVTASLGFARLFILSDHTVIQRPESISTHPVGSYRHHRRILLTIQHPSTHHPRTSSVFRKPGPRLIEAHLLRTSEHLKHTQISLAKLAGQHHQRFFISGGSACHHGAVHSLSLIHI